MTNLDKPLLLLTFYLLIINLYEFIFSCRFNLKRLPQRQQQQINSPNFQLKQIPQKPTQNQHKLRTQLTQ